MANPVRYIHHRVDCSPLAWKAVADQIVASASGFDGGVLYGVWRSQIGQPRDTLNVMTAWSDVAKGEAAFAQAIGEMANVTSHEATHLTPTLRPADATPPVRQGNFAFRWFETPEQHWPEFLQLCADAWPDFESSYDSQVVGLWEVADGRQDGVVGSLLMTRRPDLAMWERSKIPQGEVEEAVRAKLNRRYDICNSTWVYTTTLLTAEDREDKARWT